MVITANLNFPFSQSSILSSKGVLICTSTNPYKSNSSIANPYKSFNCNTPISIGLSFTNYQSQPMTITVSNVLSNANINVYKNGVFYSTIPNAYYNSTAISKSFLMSSSASQTVFYFNSYVFNVGFQRFYPSDNTYYGTIDTYEFYCPVTYTVSSTVSPLVYISSSPISYLIDVNTTVLTSSFSNFSYAGGSSDTSGYTAYSLYDYLPTYADIWNGSQAQAYYPTTIWSLWQGIFQFAALYVTQIYISYGNLTFKQQTFTGNSSVNDQQIRWIQNDSSTGNLISKIYGSALSGTLNFENNASVAANGFSFFNGIINAYSGIKIGTYGIGTTIKSFVCFSYTYGSGSSFNRTLQTLTFPNSYSDATKLLIFIQPYNFNSSGDEFSITITNITTTDLLFNVRRIDASTNWGLSLKLAVFIVELT